MSSITMTFPELVGHKGLFKDGDWVESKDQDPEGAVRLIQLADVGVGYFINKSSRFMNEEKARQLKCTFLKAGDILVARMPDPIGRACIFPGLSQECVTVVDVCIIRVDPLIVDRNWLVHFINSCSFSNQIQNWITGTTRQRISRGNLSKVKIPLPPLEEQKRIAAILDKADALRRKRERAIKLTDDLLRSVFLDMFGDPVENPKGWKVEKLDNISTKISSGSTPVGGKKVYVEQGITFLRSQNVWRKKIELDDVAYIDEATHQRMNKTSLKNRDILITKTGRINTENSSLGRAALFLGEDDTANINGHVYLIRLKPGVINEFVLYIITTEEYRDYIRSVCVGGIDKRQINKEHLEQFPIIAPPIEEQQKFLEVLQVVEKQKVALNKQLEHANEMFYSLTQRAFSGALTQKDMAA